MSLIICLHMGRECGYGLGMVTTFAARAHDGFVFLTIAPKLYFGPCSNFIFYKLWW